MFRKLSVAAGVAALALMASPAAATHTIEISGASGTFGDDDVTCAIAGPCTFEETFNFVSPEGYELVSATLTSVAQSALTDINFSLVTLNGVSFNPISTGQVEFYSLLNQALIPGGNNTIRIEGTTGGDGAYSGTLAFSAAVPEPGTWAMMLIGFGAAGIALRRGRPRELAQIA